MAACEIPLAAASVLKSSSHAWKLPVPQGPASAALVDIVSAALTARTRRKIIEICTDWLRSGEETGRYVGGNRGQNKAWAASRARWDHPRAACGTAGHPSTGGSRMLLGALRSTRRPCAAMETMQLGNRPRNAARGEGEAG